MQSFQTCRMSSCRMAGALFLLLLTVTSVARSYNLVKGFQNLHNYLKARAPSVSQNFKIFFGGHLLLFLILSSLFLFIIVQVLFFNYTTSRFKLVFIMYLLNFSSLFQFLYTYLRKNIQFLKFTVVIFQDDNFDYSTYLGNLSYTRYSLQN